MLPRVSATSGTVFTALNWNQTLRARLLLPQLGAGSAGSVVAAVVEITVLYGSAPMRVAVAHASFGTGGGGVAVGVACAQAGPAAPLATANPQMHTAQKKLRRGTIRHPLVPFLRFAGGNVNSCVAWRPRYACPASRRRPRAGVGDADRRGHSQGPKNGAALVGCDV